MRSLLPLPLVAGLLIACGASTADTAEKQPATPGGTLFNAQCAICHGRGGDLGLSGAKDLTKSTLTREEMIAIVTNGKGGMMAYGKVLTPTQIEQVVDHARSLHTAE